MKIQSVNPREKSRHKTVQLHSHCNKDMHRKKFTEHLKDIRDGGGKFSLPGEMGGEGVYRRSVLVNQFVHSFV